MMSTPYRQRGEWQPRRSLPHTKLFIAAPPQTTVSQAHSILSDDRGLWRACTSPHHQQVTAIPAARSRPRTKSPRFSEWITCPNLTRCLRAPLLELCGSPRAGPCGETFLKHGQGSACDARFFGPECVSHRRSFERFEAKG